MTVYNLINILYESSIQNILRTHPHPHRLGVICYYCEVGIFCAHDETMASFDSHTVFLLFQMPWRMIIYKPQRWYHVVGILVPFKSLLKW